MKLYANEEKEYGSEVMTSTLGNVEPPTCEQEG
jgi:hypothetical protein